MNTWFKRWGYLILILGLAAALRISLLFFRGTLWFDELFSIHFSSLESWALSWKYWTLETNPPLYTFILRFWLKLGSAANPFFTRSLALIFGLGSIAALYRLGREMFNRRAASLAALFLALSGIHLVMSTETRAYTLFGFLVILSSLYFYRLFFLEKNTRANWLGYGIITALLLYVHLTAVIMPAAQFLTLICLRANKKNWRDWWKVHILAGILWLPWLAAWWLSKFNAQTASGWFFDADLFGHANIFSLISTAFFVNNYGGSFVVTVVMLILLAGIVRLSRRFPEDDEAVKRKNAYLLLWSGLPIVAASLLGIFVPKYVFFGYPALYLLAGYLIDKLASDVKSWRAVSAAILLLIGPSSLIIATTTVFSWRPFIEYVEKNETDTSIVLLAYPETLAFNHFYKGRRPVVGIYLNDDDLSDEERIVRFNWNKQLTTDAELAIWVERQLNNYGAKRIFLIQNSISYSWLQTILQKRGWRERDRIRAPGYTESFLIDLYDAAADNPTTARAINAGN